MNKKVADKFWYLAAERQKIFFNRLANMSPPYTQDEILQTYSFTNAYRASDRVSQYLIKEVIYKGDVSPQETLFRILLFKTFNSIETWEGLISIFGEIRFNKYSFSHLNKALCLIKENNGTIYSSAYIMPSGTTFFGSNLKHQNNLKLLEKMFAESFVDKLQDTKSLSQVYDLLLSFPSIGPFLAYQYTIDINYSRVINFDENDFVVAGPGARSGIKKYFGDLKKRSEEFLIMELVGNQENEFKKRDLNFKNLWGRPLKAIDIQNLFCEVDKYTRVKYPEIQGIGNRTRIKRKFRLGRKIRKPWYPPKWGINK